MSEVSQVRRLWWLSESSLAMLGERLDAATAAWARAWGLPAPLPGQLRKADADDVGAVVRTGAGGAGQVVGPLPAGLERCLEQALFGSDTGAGLAAEASRLAQAALVAALEDVVGSVPSPEPMATAGPGDAGAVYTLQIGQVAVVVTVPVAWWMAPDRQGPDRAAAPPRLPDWSPRNALSEVAVALEVPLGRTELTVGELALLEPGDVVLLDQALHLPLTVQAEDADVRLHAFLGQHEGRRAVQLASAPAEKKT